MFCRKLWNGQSRFRAVLLEVRQPAYCRCRRIHQPQARVQSPAVHSQHCSPFTRQARAPVAKPSPAWSAESSRLFFRPLSPRLFSATSRFPKSANPQADSAVRALPPSEWCWDISGCADSRHLIIAAIAIPESSRARTAANEASAVGRSALSIAAAVAYAAEV